MKKLLLTVIATLAICGSMFAHIEPQEAPWPDGTHWPGDIMHTYMFNANVVAYVRINGEFVTVESNWEDLEIVPVVGEEIRGREMLEDGTEYGDLYPSSNIAVYYNTGGEQITGFMLYDHGTQTEYANCVISYLATVDTPIEESLLTGQAYDMLWDGVDEETIVLSFTASEPSGITLEITPYSGERDNYFLISSPMGDVPVTSVDKLTSNEYDLYYFDQAKELEWINYKEGGDDTEFASMEGKLVAGRGYLYANSGDGVSEVVTLTFPGPAYEGETLSVGLDYVEGVDMAGWNLVGNPFNVAATIDKETFYVMNEAGTEVMSASGEIAPMQGVFVLATAPEQSVVFTAGGTGAKVSMLSLNLVSCSKVVDRASVSFGGSSLPKFQINSGSTKLYIPMDGEDYAVVGSAEMGEMPVNFKAEKSGSYSLVVSTEVSFNYLHLIDNKTGVDVDLLANPSYSFEAQTTDYASRFKLVFATGNSDDTFAFYSNGSFVISNEGEAVVQVMDVTGRMLSSEAISGSASINVDGAAGVYMIRLVNGESVKVQKVVVK